VNASQDGSLEQVLNDIKLDVQKDEAAPPAAEGVSTADALRQEACDVLTKACMDGSLGSILAEIAGEKKAVDLDNKAKPPPAAGGDAPAAQPSPKGAGGDAMMMSSVAMQGPAFASLGVSPSITMI